MSERNQFEQPNQNPESELPPEEAVIPPAPEREVRIADKAEEIEELQKAIREAKENE